MAYNVVQSVNAVAASGSSLAATITTANLTSGNKIIVLVTADNTTTSTVKDGAANSWTKMSAISANAVELSLWALDCPAGDAGTKPTLTATFAAASNGCAILVQEVSGLLAGNTTAMLDGTPGTESAAVGSSTSSPTYSSTALNEYLVACYGDDGLTQAITWTKPSGYTADTNAVNSSADANCAISWENSTNGAESGNYTENVTSDDKVQILGAFQLAAAAAGVTWVPQRYVQPAPFSPAPWLQRDRRDANTVATAANPLVSPLDTAWQAGGQYWHLYGDTAARDRRAYFYQRPLVSDPNLLAATTADPLLLNPEQSPSSDLWRIAIVPAFYPPPLVPRQRAYVSDPLLLGTALLENELLGGAQTGAYYRVPVTHYARWWMPQQPPRNADPLLIQTAELENELLGGADTARHQHAAAYYDRREVPQQRPYISDPSFYPTVAPTDPLTVAWGAGGNYWHLYNRAADATDRRLVPQQRNYVSDPLLLTTALLENELLGGAETGKYYRTPATHAPRWWMPEQRAYVSDPLLLLPLVPLDPTQSAWVPLRLAYNLPATHTDRRLYPQQRLYWPVPPPPPVLQSASIAATVSEGTTMTATVTEGTTIKVTVSDQATITASVS